MIHVFFGAFLSLRRLGNYFVGCVSPMCEESLQFTDLRHAEKFIGVNSSRESFDKRGRLATGGIEGCSVLSTCKTAFSYVEYLMPVSVCDFGKMNHSERLKMRTRILHERRTCGLGFTSAACGASKMCLVASQTHI